MHIIISPTKKMRYVENNLEITEPELLEDTLEILSWLKDRTYSELKTIWQCNDKLAEQNYERIKSMELDKRVTPAILAYDGIVFKTIEAEKFSPKEIEYLSDKLRILSGFYGVLKPTDGVVPYRLEMQAKANILGHDDLYDFWGEKLYSQLKTPIVNLASKEYYKAIEKYLGEDDVFITCNFFEVIEKKLVQKATYSKIARGEMVRYMAENNVQEIEKIKRFDKLGYKYSEDNSSEREYNFYRETKSKYK